MALLFVGIAGSQAGKKFVLASELTIGREAGNTICLPNDAGVSRRHARIFWLQGLPMIEDMGSRNGTLLNGARISQARPVSSGDEIRIGSEVFRVEAAMDQPATSPTQAQRLPGQERSAGEGRGRRNRRYERSGAEGTLYKPPTGDAGPGGCAMPDFDLSGCMRYLWLLLLILLVAAILALIVFGIGALLSAAGGVGAAGTAPPQAQSAPQNNPPPPGGSGGQAPPPAQQQQQQQQQSGEAVVVVEVKVDFAKRGGSLAIPVVLVKWVNGTKTPVNRLTGTVKLFDREGKLIVEIPRETIYSGPPVQGGETHEDSLEDGGVSIRQKLSGIPSTAQVQIDKVE